MIVGKLVVKTLLFQFYFKQRCVRHYFVKKLYRCAEVSDEVNVPIVFDAPMVCYFGVLIKSVPTRLI